MGRHPRVEYEGAIYHVLNRGNRQEPIFHVNEDHLLFLDTLGEACGRTGWKVHAYALMGNHYHLLLETPEPNLVDGMRWLQGTYTKRFNIRHNQCGHLFQGRYKALLVDSGGNYFSTAGNYIHLNPARARCFDLAHGVLSDYPWSSYPLYLNPLKRPEWLCVDRLYGSCGLDDAPSGRARYAESMQKRILQIAGGNNSKELLDEWNRVRHEWAYGSEEFRERMRRKMDEPVLSHRRDSYAGQAIRNHDEHVAEQLFREGLLLFGLSEEILPSLKKGDPRKKVIAWHIRRKTSIRNEWIGRKLYMGSVSNLSRFFKEVGEAHAGPLAELRKMIK